MDYIHKLPFFFGALAAIFIGIYNYIGDTDTSTVFIKMAVSMVVFFLAGLVMRNMLVKTIEEVEEKKRKQEAEEERKRLEEIEKQRQEELKQANAREAAANAPTKIDFRTGPDTDDLTPLKLEKITLNRSADNWME